MKRIHLIVFAFLLSLLTLISCSGRVPATKEKPLIITTIYPYELIVRELVDTLFTVETLLPPNASPHTWSPSPQDMVKSDKADVVISNGLGLEINLEKLLEKKGNKLIVASSYIDKSRLISDEHEQAEQSIKNSHDNAGQPNPHIWTAPDFLISIITGLNNDIVKRYPEFKTVLDKRATLMINEVKQVEDKIKQDVAAFKQPAIITLHDAFIYFFEYFKIEFIGSVQPTAGKDPAPRQLKDLADKIKLKKIRTIFIEPQMNPKPAEILAQELNLEVLKYDDLGTTLYAKTIADYLWQNWLLIKAGL